MIYLKYTHLHLSPAGPCVHAYISGKSLVPILQLLHQYLDFISDNIDILLVLGLTLVESGRISGSRVSTLITPKILVKIETLAIKTKMATTSGETVP